MPRRRWSAISTANGWFEVIGGPRLPAVQVASCIQGQGKGKGTKKPATAVTEPRKVQSKSEPKGHVASIEAAIRALGLNPEPTVLASLKDALRKAKDVEEPKPARVAVYRSPDEVRADAVARVASLEAAIAALGDHDDQAQKSLEEALAKAKKSANVAPVGARLNYSMNFIERLRKRLTTKDADISKKEEEHRQLQSQRAEGMVSLVAAEARLESLRAEAAASTDVPAPLLDELQAELASFRSREVVAGTEVDEEEGASSTDLSHTRKSRRLGPGAESWPPEEENVPLHPELVVDRDRVEVRFARSQVGRGAQSGSSQNFAQAFRPLEQIRDFVVRRRASDGPFNRARI